MRELAVFYSAAVRGQDPLSQVQPLPVQYRDFSIWQRQEAQADEHQKQLSYWVEQLQTSRPAELFCDKPRPSALSGQAEARFLEINGPLFVKLQDFCQMHGVTQFVVLFAAFRATHFRLTGQDDATIGTVNANRDRWETRDMIGFFVNMQCLRTSIRDGSFEQLVQQVHDVAVASHANADVPFESIVSKLRNDRDLSRHPLAQLVFAVHAQRDLGQLRLEGLQTESWGDAATSRFDLEFHFSQQSDGLQGNVLFSTDLYTAETIDNMLSVFQCVLEACLADPKAAIASLPLLDTVGLSRLNDMELVQVEKTAYPREASIVDLFRQQVQASPSGVAVKDATTQMTYAQLDAASDMLARWLAVRSLAPETLVGVLASRSCETIVAYLGILKAHLAYLPFDVKISSTRMEAILASLPGGRIVLVGADVQPPSVKLSNVEFVSIAESLSERAEQTSEEPHGPSATSLAYVMFTSGSTGQPKGVMVEHRGIVRLVRDNNLVQHLPAMPIMAHMANLGFDVSTWEIFATLLNGGTLVCIDQAVVFNAEAILATFRHNHVRAAIMTPSLYRTYALQSPRLFSGLDMLCLGGEAVLPLDVVGASEHLTGKLVNACGPTENTGASTIFLISHDEEYVNGVPIGRALSNSGAYVMDAKQQLVPLGVVGELVVTGDGLARGYTDPKRDVDRFISVKIAGETVKAYRTGDYVRHRPTDGQLEFFGRMDGQVKIRGNRVELGEIEYVLRSDRAVREAVTVLQQHDGGEAHLASFVTVHEDAETADDPADDANESQHVGVWEEKFNSDVYTPIVDVRSENIGRDFVGWTSMYDGSDIDKAEMDEWLDDTIDTILNGQRAGHVLEIGSGTGMILFNLGEGLQSYVGLDPSQKAVQFIVETAKSIPALADKIHMYKATAADIGRLERPTPANLVVVNSVVQYFPSLDYLFRTIRQLAEFEGTRTLFFGDVRSYALYREFLATRALHMADGKASKADVRRMMADMERVERELLVDPAFFTALPSRLPGLVEHVEILPKRMKATNELSCYRYAAVVHIRSKEGQAAKQEQAIRHIEDDKWIDFAERKLDRQSLLQQLKSLSSSCTQAVSNIPYSKTTVSRFLVHSLDSAEAEPSDSLSWLSSVHQQAQELPSLSTTDLIELAQEAGCRVEISWNRQCSQRGGLDAIFHRFQPQDGKKRVMFRFPTDHAERPLHNLSSKPLRQQYLQATQQRLVEMLEAQLPAYMVPQTLVALDAMPVNQNGKVDRKALEQRVDTKEGGFGVKEQPSTQAERTMQQLWARVLGLDAESIGLDDSFFRLGGDSIAAMKLVGEARRAGLQLTVADLFRNPNLSSLANLHPSHSVFENVPAFSLLPEDADTMQIREEVASSCGLPTDLVQDIYPCSPLQEGMMALTLKKAGNYTMQTVLELRDDIDEVVFRAAWGHIVQSTAILRTRIVQHNKLGLLQVVVTAENIQWIEAEDLAEYLQADESAPMELDNPLARYALIKEAHGGRRWMSLTLHHVLYDGWSLPMILNAVTKRYHGGVVEKQTSFHTFIKYLGEQDQHLAATYWQATLVDCQAAIFPPLPPSVHQPLADTEMSYQCPPLPKIPSDTTTSTLIRAAWAILASRYTNLDDVVFGATVTGRNAPVAGIETIAGPTIATVPVRVRVRSDQTVSAFLKDLQQQATQMITYEQTGLQTISKMGPDARHACNFQTLLIVQPAPENQSNKSEESLGEWRSCSDLKDFTTYGLMVQCVLAAEGIQIIASFDRRVMDDWLVKKVLSQFSFVLQQLASADAQTNIANIDTVTPEDRQQLWTWNQDVPPAVDRCIHNLFAEQALIQPDAPAIYAWDGELTYGELDTLSTRLAGHLVKLGIGSDDIVPLCFEKSMWAVVAMLAVLKAGGAFVPLDPEHPPIRQRLVLEQTRAKLVLSSEQHSSRWENKAQEVVVVTKSSIQQLSGARKQTHSGVHPSNAAYVLFTSGSTGIPKGVVIEHKALSTSCLGHGKAFNMSPYTRALQFTSYTADISITEIITTLVYGGCVCVPSDSDRRDDIAFAIQKLRANWAYLTPTVARLLDVNAVPSLEVLLLGGEPVTTEECKRWEGKVELINTYGPTECCVLCSAFFGIEGFRTGLIGNSIASVSWVVETNNIHKLAPVGSIGELVVEGPILARGYLDDTNKTNAAFIADPDWLVQGSDIHPGRRGRVYRTGDLAYYNPDGTLTCAGRKDGQVKVKGRRVELGEIEYHIRKCMPEPKEIAVELIVPTGRENHATLAAFIQQTDVASSATITTPLTEIEAVAGATLSSELREKLSELLPDYMVPTVFIALEQFPMTTSGKTDRKMLRKIGASLTAQQLAELQTSGQGPKQQPSTETERAMQQLWARVLGLDAESIGLDDSFFRLGGDSIAAMKLVGEAARDGIKVTTSDIFMHPKLANLCLVIRPLSIRHSDPIPPFSLLPPATKAVLLSAQHFRGIKIQPENIVDMLPVTFSQKLFLDLGRNDPRVAFNYFYLEMGPQLDLDLLQDSCRKLVDHFPILRTRFVSFQEQWFQLVLRELELSFTVLDVDESLDKAFHSICTREVERTDPLEAPTMFKILRSNSANSRLIVRLSHAQYDGVCLPIIIRTLVAIYQQESLHPTAEYSTYIAYARKMYCMSRHYWRGLLQGSRLTKATENFQIEGQEQSTPCLVHTEKYIDTPRLPEGITMASLLSSAWAMVLSIITGEEDIVFGHLVAGRNSDIPQVAEIVGPCLNIIPVRTDVCPAKTSQQLVQSVQTQQASLGQSDSMGWDEIVQDCTDWPADSLFDSLVQHQNVVSQPEIHFAGATAKLDGFRNPFAVVPQLSLFSEPKGKQLRIVIAGNTHFLTDERANKLADLLDKMVSALLFSPHASLASIYEDLNGYNMT